MGTIARRFGCKEQTNARPDFRRGCGGLEVQLNEQVGPRIQPPGQPFRRERRHLSGCPREDVAFRKCRRKRNQPCVAAFRIRLVEAMRCGRSIDEEIRVVNERISRLKLEAANVPHRRHADRHDEIPECVRRAGRHDVFGEIDNQIWRAELPACRPSRCGRQLTRVALQRPALLPTPKDVDLAISVSSAPAASRSIGCRR